MPVDILMATFNGEKYIRNQLLSLQAQTYGDWLLWVLDDGSTDRTTAIVDEFAARDPRIKRVPSPLARLGPGKNFLGLLERASCELVAFCDQDDIWFERKLELLVKFAEDRFDNTVPCLAYCDGHAYSDAEGVITSSFVSYLHAKNLREFLFFNAGYQGCFLLINSCLARMARDYDEPFYMHDDIVSLMAHVFGKVYFLPKALVLYRQHGQNVTLPVARSQLQIVRRFFRSDAHVISRTHYEEKLYFYKHFQSVISPQERAIFQAYFRYPCGSLFERLFIILRHGFSLGGYRIPLMLKTLLRKPIG